VPANLVASFNLKVRQPAPLPAVESVTKSVAESLLGDQNRFTFASTTAREGVGVDESFLDLV
jgi:hypothetical protein